MAESTPLIVELKKISVLIFTHFNRLNAMNVNIFANVSTLAPSLFAKQQNYCHLQRKTNILFVGIAI